VVARVNEMRNEWLFTDAWGVDVAVSTPRAMVAGVEGAIDIGHLVRLMQLREGQVNLAKLTLPEGNAFVGQRIRELTLSDNTALAAVLRGSEVLLPKADEVLQVGDEMLFVAGGALDDEVRALVRAAAAPVRRRRTNG